MRSSGDYLGPVSSSVPNDGNAWDGLFVRVGSSTNDWLMTQDDHLWQGVSGVNTPGPIGYRLPTEAEWEAERLSWSSNNSAGAYASPLKLTLAGSRLPSLIFNVGTNGYFWSSTVSGTSARRLNFISSNAAMNATNRAYGFSVRCLKD